jgi:hypothetical protein
MAAKQHNASNPPAESATAPRTFAAHKLAPFSTDLP